MRWKDVFDQRNYVIVDISWYVRMESKLIVVAELINLIC